MTTNNPYSRESYKSSPIAGTRMFAISPSDDTDLTQVIKRLRITNPTIEVASLNLLTAGGDQLAIPILPGIWFEELQIVKIFSTGTSPELYLHGISDSGTPIVEGYDDGLPLLLDLTVDGNSIWFGAI